MIGGLATFFALSYLIVHPVIGSAGPGPQTLSSLAQAHFTHLREPSIASDRYDGHQVWRLDWRTIDQELKTDILLAIELLNVDVWRSSPSALDIRLSPAQKELLRPFLPPDIPLINFISDLQSLVDLSSPTPFSGLSTSDLTSLDTPFHDSYHSLEEIYAFGDGLVEQFPGMVEAIEVGKSFEGLAIRGWKAHVTVNDGGSHVHRGRRGPKGKKGQVRDKIEGTDVLEFVVQSGQHAREWIGPSTALYFLHALVVDATNEPSGEIARLLRSFTFTVFPTINPDGYAYSHEHNRMWRKNRQELGTRLCSGIDLNSNWGYKWRPGRSTSTCSDSYSGQMAFEAYETRAMANYLANGTTWCADCDRGEGEGDEGKRPGRRVRAFVDLHSYGQLFMFPFAHSCDDFPPDAEMLMEAGLGVAKTMRRQQGEGYQAGQACDLTYRAPGDAIDYSYGVTDVQWSYSAELRDTGTYGFLLPPKLIRPAADELTAGLLYLARFIYNVEIAG